MGRQTPILQLDRRRRHRRAFHARHPEGRDGEDGSRSAHGIVRPRHTRHNIRRQDAPRGFERDLVQAGRAQRVQGGVPQRGSQDTGAYLFGRGAYPQRVYGRRDERFAEPPRDDYGHGVRQGLRPPERARASGRTLPLFDVAVVAHLGRGDLHHPTSRCPPTCRRSCSRPTPTPTRSNRAENIFGGCPTLGQPFFARHGRRGAYYMRSLRRRSQSAKATNPI